MKRTHILAVRRSDPLCIGGISAQRNVPSEALGRVFDGYANNESYTRVLMVEIRDTYKNGVIEVTYLRVRDEIMRDRIESSVSPEEEQGRMRRLDDINDPTVYEVLFSEFQDRRS